MFNINDIVNKDNYTEAAIFCNKSGDRHIELVDGKYMIVANPPAPEPTVEEKVAYMESSTGLNRPMRELVLSENSGASDYVKAKAQEIEALVAPLRVSEDQNEINEAKEAEALVETAEQE